MKIVAETETSVCLNHDYMLFLVPLPMSFDVVGHYIDRCGKMQVVFHRSVYGEQIHNALKAYNKKPQCTCLADHPDYCEVHAA